MGTNLRCPLNHSLQYCREVLEGFQGALVDRPRETSPSRTDVEYSIPCEKVSMCQDGKDCLESVAFRLQIGRNNNRKLGELGGKIISMHIKCGKLN